MMSEVTSVQRLLHSMLRIRLNWAEQHTNELMPAPVLVEAFSVHLDLCGATGRTRQRWVTVLRHSCRQSPHDLRKRVDIGIM